MLGKGKNNKNSNYKKTKTTGITITQQKANVQQPSKNFKCYAL